MIDAYLATLRRELRGPRVLRANMIREVRDGLHDATRAHRDDGVSPAEAERRAVDEFGPPSVVAAGLRDELAAATGRYLAALSIVLGSTQFALAHYTWQTAAREQGWPRPSPEYGMFAQAVDVSNIVVLVALALAVPLLGRGGRFVPTHRVVRIMGIGVLVSLLVDVVVGTVLNAFAPQGITVWKGPELPILFALSIVSVGWTASVAWRCVRLTSPGRSGPEDRPDDAAGLVPVVLPRR
ncbi:hypothetical protein CLV30_10258 [Haloactinopolyspora alba]|uniref:Uncharacterized protein n=1 Tax=Haloactinopolyspora alba TaxID=648780 RepID=A0A2P8EB30_9ACTN|nr:permease prefix domain 1-containing protein [Haloactinopolyspora alba]PSL06673.1 hypothetical protein CLV30_10258 [Haloactinopolyspora alba]